MAKFFILFALMAMSVSSQPIEPLMTSEGGTGGVLALLKNLGQVVLETFLEWAKRGFAMPQISKKSSDNRLIFLVNNQAQIKVLLALKTPRNQARGNRKYLKDPK